MQGSESEAVFDSLNLNPQLFINEVLNAVDDLVDGAFDFYHQKASEILGDVEEDRSDELKRGIASLHHLVQAVLDKRLGMWEKYCLRHCFTVPTGFSLSKAVPLSSLSCNYDGSSKENLGPASLGGVFGNQKDSSGNNLLLQDVLSNAELDAELDSLREKLVVIGRESAELHREVRSLEKQSLLSSSCVGSITEALKPFEQSSTHDIFHEMVRAASELRKKLQTVNSKRREEMECTRIKRIYNPSENLTMIHNKGLSVNLKDLQEFVDGMTNM